MRKLLKNTTVQVHLTQCSPPKVLCTILLTPGLHWTQVHTKFTSSHQVSTNNTSSLGSQCPPQSISPCGNVYKHDAYASRSPCSTSTNTTSHVYLAQCSFPPILGNYLTLTFTLLALSQENNKFEQGSWVPQLQGSHQMHAFILSFLCWNHVNQQNKKRA